MQLDLGVGERREIHFRNYQTEAIDAVRTNYERGINRQLIVLPTSCGKTIIFSGIAQWRLAEGEKVLILAHRDELLGQAREKMSWVIGNGYAMQIEMAEEWADENSDVILASVQTIGRADSKRIQRFDPKDFGLFIIDEAHHATATTYQNVINYFVENRKDILLVGVTATPNRSDEESLADVFQSVVYQKTMLDMARLGWVAPIVSYRISSKTDLSRVKTVAGDYNLKELAATVNNEERNTLIVETYLKKFHGQQALVFACDIEHVMRLTQQFQDAGMRSANVTSVTPDRMREEIVSGFKAGQIDILVNYGVFTEGFDHDALGLIIMARPTQSALLLTQMVGRGNRLHEKKKRCEVVEIVDYHSTKTATVASIFGFKKEFDCESHDFLECCNKAEELQKDFQDYNPYNTMGWTEMIAKYEAFVYRRDHKNEIPEGDGGGAERKKRDDLYFEQLAKSEYFENRYRFTYVGIDKLAMRFRGSFWRYLAKVSKTALGSWVGEILRKPEDMPVSSSVHAETAFVCTELHQLDAVKQVETWILANEPELDILLNVNAKWKKVAEGVPCTDKQYAIIQRNRLTAVPRERISKRFASELISAFFDKNGR